MVHSVRFLIWLGAILLVIPRTINKVRLVILPATMKMVLASQQFKNLKVWTHGLISWAHILKLLLDDCHRTHLLISQHWFRWWLGYFREETIKWANIDPDLCRHLAALDHFQWWTFLYQTRTDENINDYGRDVYIMPMTTAVSGSERYSYQSH